MAFRASTSRINIQRQPSLREDGDDPAQLGKFERRGHYEACGTVKLLLAFPQEEAVKALEQAFLAEVSFHHLTASVLYYL